jgi:hypothetical protein
MVIFFTENCGRLSRQASSLIPVRNSVSQLDQNTGNRYKDFVAFLRPPGYSTDGITNYATTTFQFTGNIHINSRYTTKGFKFSWKNLGKIHLQDTNRWKYLQSSNRLGGSEQGFSCMCDKWRALVNAVMNLRDYLPLSQLPTGGLQIKKNLKATSELWAPEECHEARSTPRTHKCYAPPNKI